MGNVIADLAFALLAIVDLSAGRVQPITNDNGRLPRDPLLRPRRPSVSSRTPFRKSLKHQEAERLGFAIRRHLGKRCEPC